MPRLALIHWKPEEATAQIASLEKTGLTVEAIAPDGSAGLSAVRRKPPDVFVIDLTRIPSRGRAVGVALRQYKDTRSVPIVFAGGAADSVEQTRSLMPDAAYAEWPDVPKAVRAALKKAPQKPVVPNTMAGYSGTPLPKKLGIKAGTTLLLGAPEGFEQKLDPLPDGAIVRRRGGAAVVVMLFVKSAAELAKRFEPGTRAIAEGGRIWIVWPKKAANPDSDIGEREVREFGLARGFVDFKVCAVDETWSGLAFVRRKATAKSAG